jgi:hypothetical protein
MLEYLGALLELDLVSIPLIRFDFLVCLLTEPG